MANDNIAAAKPQPTENQPQQQPQGKICYGDCFRCSYQQAWMCASMHARRAMRTSEELMEAIGILTQEIVDMKKQVDDLQAKFDKEGLINPLEGTADVEDEQEPPTWPHVEPEPIDEDAEPPEWMTNPTIQPIGQSAEKAARAVRKK